MTELRIQTTQRVDDEGWIGDRVPKISEQIGELLQAAAVVTNRKVTLAEAL